MELLKLLLFVLVFSKLTDGLYSISHQLEDIKNKLHNLEFRKKG